MERIGDGRRARSSAASTVAARCRGSSRAWPDAVGDEVARNAWPARVARDGTLHVHTSSSAWAFELGQLAPKILERLRAALGDAAPTALRFAPGHLPEPPPTAGRGRSRPVRARSPEARREAAALAAAIADEELRERVARGGSRSGLVASL